MTKAKVVGDLTNINELLDENIRIDIHTESNNYSLNAIITIDD